MEHIKEYNANTFTSVIARKIAFHIGNWLQELNMNAISNSYDPKSSYWGKRMELLQEAFNTTRVVHIDYFNMKYLLRFYAELFQNDIARLLGLAE